MNCPSCNSCNQEFSEQDRRDGNYSESMGKYSHKVCPGTPCKVCGRPINGLSEAKRGTFGYQHKSCKPVAIDPRHERARRAALRDEEAEEHGCDASSWIVRK